MCGHPRIHVSTTPRLKGNPQGTQNTENIRKRDLPPPGRGHGSQKPRAWGVEKRKSVASGRTEPHGPGEREPEKRTGRTSAAENTNQDTGRAPAGADSVPSSEPVCLKRPD